MTIRKALLAMLMIAVFLPACAALQTLEYSRAEAEILPSKIEAKAPTSAPASPATATPPVRRQEVEAEQEEEDAEETEDAEEAATAADTTRAGTTSRARRLLNDDDDDEEEAEDDAASEDAKLCETSLALTREAKSRA